MKKFILIAGAAIIIPTAPAIASGSSMGGPTPAATTLKAKVGTAVSVPSTRVKGALSGTAKLKAGDITRAGGSATLKVNAVSGRALNAGTAGARSKTSAIVTGNLNAKVRLGTTRLTGANGNAGKSNVATVKVGSPAKGTGLSLGTARSSDRRTLVNVSALNKSAGKSGRIANVSVLNGSGSKGRTAVNVSALNKSAGTSGRIANVSVLNGSGSTGRGALVNVSVLNKKSASSSGRSGRDGAAPPKQQPPDVKRDRDDRHATRREVPDPNDWSVERRKSRNLGYWQRNQPTGSRSQVWVPRRPTESGPNSPAQGKMAKGRVNGTYDEWSLIHQPVSK